MIGTCCRLGGCAAPCRQLYSMNKRGKREGASADHRSPIGGGGGAQLETFFFGGMIAVQVLLILPVIFCFCPPPPPPLLSPSFNVLLNRRGVMLYTYPFSGHRTMGAPVWTDSVCRTGCVQT